MQPPAESPMRLDSTEATRPIAIASSTGGCWVLADLVRALDRRPVGPVLVAQHMDPEFVSFFARWLETAAGRTTCVVTGPTPLRADTVYVAQGGCDLCVTDNQHVHAAPASGRFIPSANRLFRTFAEAFGPAATAVVLSGMGEDGAEGLKAVLRRGGRGYCQLPSTAIIPSMPASALKAAQGAVALAPEAIALALTSPALP
jgi:two-component system chemotaxis response regulator CheB